MSNSIQTNFKRLLFFVRARPLVDLESTHHQRGPVVRYIAVILGLVVVAFLGIPVVGALASDRGGAAPMLVEASSPSWALLVLIILVGVMTIVACCVARQVNAAVGLFVLGCGLGVIAMRSGGVAEFAWGSGSLWAVGFETIVWGAVVILQTLIVMWVSRGLPDVPHDWKSPPVGSPAALLSKASLTSLLCGLIALPIAWLLLADDLKGQALGAAIVGSFIAGTAGRLAAPRLDPILIFGAPALAGGLAQLVIASGWSEPPALALVEGTFPRLVWLMPLDWAAGSLIGVSMGVGWARSFIREAGDHGDGAVGEPEETSRGHSG